MKKLIQKILKNWKRIVSALIILYVVYLIIDVVFLDKSGELEEQETEIDITSSTLTGYSEGVRKWIFTAENISSEENSALAENVSKGIIYKEQKEFIDIVADTIKINMQSNNFDAKDNVVVDVIGENQTFFSDNMVWDNNQEKIMVDGRLTAEFKDCTLTGHNLIYYVGEGKYEMEEGVKLEFDVEMP